MDEPHAMLALLAEMDRRRRRSVLVLLIVNGLAALGLAAFFVGPELIHVARDIAVYFPDAPGPPDPRVQPFVPTTELRIVPDAAKVVGINYPGRDFFLAPRSDGEGWFRGSLGGGRDIDRALSARLAARLERLPAAPVDDAADAYTPHALRILVEGREPFFVLVGDTRPGPDVTSTFFQFQGGPPYRIAIDDARALYPDDAALAAP